MATRRGGGLRAARGRANGSGAGRRRVPRRPLHTVAPAAAAVAAAAAAAAAAAEETVIYVGNLSYATTWQGLKDHMRTVGEVTHADVMMEVAAGDPGPAS